MSRYIAIVHKDQNSAYGVTFPDLPGCYSAADRLEGVLPNAMEALNLWLEDKEEVAPRSRNAIEIEYAGEIAAGATLVEVPRQGAAP